MVGSDRIFFFSPGRLRAMLPGGSIWPIWPGVTLNRLMLSGANEKMIVFYFKSAHAVRYRIKGVPKTG